MTNDEKNTRLLSEAAEEAFWAGGTGEPLAMRETPSGKERVYDLEERTSRFGEAIIDFALAIPQGPVTNRLISQRLSEKMIGSSQTSERVARGSLKSFFCCITYLTRIGCK